MSFQHFYAHVLGLWHRWDSFSLCQLPQANRIWRHSRRNKNTHQNLTPRCCRHCFTLTQQSSTCWEILQYTCRSIQVNIFMSWWVSSNWKFSRGFFFRETSQFRENKTLAHSVVNCALVTNFEHGIYAILEENMRKDEISGKNDLV